MTLDWALVRSFLAVMEHGSLLAAARALSSSQPTIGRHVAALERTLGVALFERTGRGLVPTEAARLIVDPAQAMSAQADSIGRAVAGAARRIEGTVRISASQTVAVHLLPSLVARLRASEPGIQVEIVATNLLSNLLRREADIAVRMVRPQQGSLVSKRIVDVTVGAYASLDYLQRRGVPKTPAELAAHDLVGFDTDDTLLRAFSRAGSPVTRDRFCIRSDDHLVAWEAVRAGAGIGFAARYLAARDPRVQRVLPELAVAPLPMWLAVHREIRSSPRIRRAFDFLASALPEAVLE